MPLSLWQEQTFGASFFIFWRICLLESSHMRGGKEEKEAQPSLLTHFTHHTPAPRKAWQLHVSMAGALLTAICHGFGSKDGEIKHSVEGELS